MDIWDWVQKRKETLREAGHTRLVELLVRLPNRTCADDHAAVDAMYPEALALVRDLGDPWLEVFVRHWYLQSRVLHRGDVDGATSEATALLEFASREEARDCPQSICVAQDFANCFGRREERGYVTERIDVARETLERIDGGWACYRCIGEELAHAYVDGGRYAEALEVITQLTAEVSRAQPWKAKGAFGISRARALEGLGRYAEALTALEEWPERDQGPGTQQMAKATEARLLARMGRLDAARRALPAPQALLDLESGERDWAAAVEVLVAAGALEPTTRHLRTLWALNDRARRYGQLGAAADVSTTAVQIAVVMGARAVAEAGLERARADVAALRNPAPMKARLAALDAAVAACPTPRVELPDDPAALAERVPSTAELALTVLAAARTRWPDDDRVCAAYARTLDLLGFTAEARSTLQGFAEGRPDDALAVVHRVLGDLLIEAGEHDAVDALTADRPGLRVLRALSLERRNRPGDALNVLADALDGPVDVDALSLYARIARATGAFDRALDALDRLAEHVGEPGEHDRQRMLCGAIAGRWDAVRESGVRLGLLPAEGEGPIDVDGPPCRVAYPDGRVWPAVMRSPVTARITGLPAPGGAQHFDDRVAFDVRPTNLDRREEEGWVPTFAVAHVIEPGGFDTHLAVGPHLVEAVRTDLAHRVDALGGHAVFVDRPDVQLTIDGASQPALLLYLVVPLTLDPKTLHDALTEATAPCPHPPAWTRLAGRTGDPAAIALHVARDKAFAEEL